MTPRACTSVGSPKISYRRMLHIVLRISGATDADRVLSANVMPALKRLSRGAPAVVNRLCAKALCIAAQSGEVIVTVTAILQSSQRVGIGYQH